MAALRTFVAVLFLASFSVPAASQMSLTSSNVAVTENFTGFTGAGFAATPAAGQLDSDAWRVVGMSDGTMAFGATKSSGTDFGRGSSAGGVTTGGIYAFTADGSTPALGVQPGGSDVNPGSIVLKVANNTGSTITSLSVSYKAFYKNDQARANKIRFGYSTNDVAYTDDATLDVDSPLAADAGAWTSFTRSKTISGLTFATGTSMYIHWGISSTGSNNHDELALDDVSVTGTSGACAPPCADGISCTDDLCNSGTCSYPISSGKCLIASGCYNDNATNPANTCQKCAASANTTWSLNDGASCTTAGGGAGLCTSGVCVGADGNSYVDVADDPIGGDFLRSDDTLDRAVFAFKVIDQGTGDSYPTTVTDLTFAPGASNDADWTDTLALAELYDGETGGNLVGTAVGISDAAIQFSDLSFEVPNGDERTLYLRLTFSEAPSLVDGSTLSFAIDSSAAGNEALAGGSTFATSGIDEVGSDDFYVDVMAFALFVVTEPARVVPGMPFAFSVYASDLYGNTDVDYNEPLYVDVDPATGGSGTLSSTTYPDLIASAVDGLAEWPDLVYDTEDTFSLLATDGSFVVYDALSSTWTATINWDLHGYAVKNLQDNLTVTLDRAKFIDDGGSASLAPGDYLVIGRDSTKAAFEAFWSVTFASNVRYVNGKTLAGGTSSGFPVVNETGTSSERFALYDAAAVLLDGASPSALQFGNGDNCARVGLATSGQLAGHWSCGLTSAVTETPGSGAVLEHTGKLVITEMSDGATSIYEFLELFYDAEYSSVCPNGSKEVGEDCDDNANGDDADGCKDDCTFSCAANTDCADADTTDCVRPACAAGGEGQVCEEGEGTAFEAAGKLCPVGACDGAGTCALSYVGAVIVTEIMPNPGACDDTVGEWLELHNTRDQAIDLAGWTLSYNNLAPPPNNTPGTHPFSGSFVIPAHGYVVLCRTSPAAEGLPCDLEGLPFALGNSGGELTLKDGTGATVDFARYQANDESGNSFTLSPCHLDALSNDDTNTNWCFGSATDTFTCGSGSDHGTPGGANRPCPGQDCFTCNDPSTDCTNTVGDCKDAVCVPSGADWICGTVNNDADPEDDGLACTADTCVVGTPSHTSTAGLPCKTDGGLPANDGWCTAGGACLANTCGDGHAFSTESCDDGANGDPNDGCTNDCAFSCLTLGAACGTDPLATDCVFPKCAVGGTGQRCEASPGTGLVAQGTSCGGAGQCDAGGNCTLPAEPGDVLVTELAFNPKASPAGCDTAGSDAAGEWIELKNVSEHAVSLLGWRLTDNGATHTITASLTLSEGELLVLCNGATKPTWCDYSYGAAIALGNGGDKLVVKDGFGTTIDEVTQFLTGWPSAVGEGVALALDPSREDGTKNDLGWSWCAGQETLVCGDTGSPGESNAPCAGGLVIPADAAKSTVRATTGVAADGHSHAIISVELKASDDTPAAGRTVTFSEGHASASVVDPTGANGTLVTDANGRAVAYVTNTEVETIAVTISDDSPAPKVTLPQPSVAFVSPTSGSAATVNGVQLSVSGGTFTQAAAYDPASMPAGLDAGLALPYGVLATTITVAPGGQAVLTVTLPARIVQSYRLYKFGSEAGQLTPHWYEITKHAKVTGFKDPNTVYTVTLTDGGFGDADGLANGVIVDPQAIVQDPSAIPTLGEWAVILLALAMVLLAVRRLRETVRPFA